MDTTKDTTMQHVTDAVIAEIKRIAEHPLKAPVIVRADTMLGVIMRLEAAEKERDALRTALEKIADWDSAWGPYPETNEAWRAMVIVTAREAVPRRGEKK